MTDMKEKLDALGRYMNRRNKYAPAGVNIMLEKGSCPVCGNAFVLVKKTITCPECGADRAEAAEEIKEMFR